MSETAPRRPRAAPALMTLTKAASDRLRLLYRQGGDEGKMLRIAVSTKGCSGMSYDMSWVDAPGPSDEMVTTDDLTVLVDRRASLFLIGTTMDYREAELESGFSFINPNEKGRCGCGESFHV